MKQKKLYVCTNCGTQHLKWMGQCSKCGEWSTLEEEIVAVKEKAASRAILASSDQEYTKLGSVNPKELTRIATEFSEVNAVLGGGFVSDQVVLLSGEPGVGKSTLLLQIAVNLSNQDIDTVYISGEESLTQIASRAGRLYAKKQYENIDFLGSPGVNALVAKLEESRPRFVIIDSIQTMYDETLSSLPGSLTQVKASTAALVSAAKRQGFTLILVGHINKDGNIAGPKVLEHLVDTVLQFEGERDGEYRLLRTLKNRFGPTGEVGLLVMTESGLKDMDPGLNVFDSADSTPGIARTFVLEGNRPLLIQVQALVNPTVFAYPKRVSEGISVARLQLICAILNKFAGAQLGDKDVYVRTTGGYRLHSSTADLAIAAAILSSIKNKALQADAVYLGEISLGGSVSLPSKLQGRVKDIKKFGISRLVSPLKATTDKGLLSQSVTSISKLF